MLGRIYPDTMSHCIQSEFLHQSSALTLLPCLVIELISLGLILSTPSDISPQPELLILHLRHLPCLLLPCAGNQQ
jgi:hypothetical protein